MNKAFFLLLFLLSVTFSQAQIQGEDEVYLDSDAMEARFQGGGLNVFQEFVFKNLDKTKIEKEEKIKLSQLSAYFRSTQQEFYSISFSERVGQPNSCAICNFPFQLSRIKLLTLEK